MSQLSATALLNIQQHEAQVLQYEQNNDNRLDVLQEAMWTETFRNAGGPGKTGVVRRIFQILYYGGLRYRTHEGAQWNPWNMPLVRALSHGGRVLIQFDQVGPTENPHAFWNWIRGNCNSFYPREGTHGIGPTIWEDIQGESSRMSKEIHGLKHGAAQAYRKGSSVNATKVSYGLDIAFGGYRRASISQRGDGYITDNGEYGTLYFYYRAPDQGKPGGLLVGLEGEAPGKWGETGNFHSWNVGPIDKVKKYKNGKLIVPAGSRWAGGGVGPKKYDGLFLDLTRTGWRRVANHHPVPFTENLISQVPLGHGAVGSATGGRNVVTVFGYNWASRWTDAKIQQALTEYSQTSRHDNVRKMHALYEIKNRASDITNHSGRNAILGRNPIAYANLLGKANHEIQRIRLAQS